MTDKAAENVSQLHSTQRRSHSGRGKTEWLHGYGYYLYNTPAQDQINIQFPWGHVSGILKTGVDSQSDYTYAHFGKEHSEDVFVLAKQLLETLGIREREFDEGFADEELVRSVEVEEQVGGRDIDTTTDDVAQRTSDDLYSAILDADSESDMPGLREMILVAEDTDFTVDQSEQLAPWLLNFAQRLRDSSDPQDEAVVWSAIRTGASMLRPHAADRLRPLLEPGYSIETSLVTVKMLGRIFEAQPPADVDEHSDLAEEVLRIAESLLNRYAITASQSAAMAQLAIYALAAMASSETHQIVETVQQLGVTWFTRRTLRKLCELQNIWASRPVPVADRPLELLDRAIPSLAE